MRRISSLFLLLLLGCAREAETGGAPAGCRVVQRPVDLPGELDESSGIAAGRTNADLAWTHNDSGGDPAVLALDARGRIVGRVALSGAENFDWEDMAAGPCPAGSCLFLGDIGDNPEEREQIVIYRAPEPAPGARTVAPEAFPARYPDGPRDAEALFVLDDGTVYIVTKGRSGPIQLFRYPPPLRPGETVELELVAQLSAERPDLPHQVTGAGASPDGRWVAVRTYSTLAIYPAASVARGDAVPSVVYDLGALGEPQGEGVDILDDGRVLLTSEAGEGADASLSVLACTLPRGG